MPENSPAARLDLTQQSVDDDDDDNTDRFTMMKHSVTSRL